MSLPPHLNCTTARYQEISKLRSYLNSTQYAGRPDFFTGKKAGSEARVPLRERKPCIIYPMPKIAAGRLVDFTFGESRFPTLQVEPQEGGNDGYSVALNEKDAEDLEKGVNELGKLVRSRMAKLMREGLACRTAIGIFSVQRGRFCVEIPRSEDCILEHEADDPSAPVTKLTWIYKFDKTVPLNGQAIQKTFWFRRDYDAQNVTEYEHAEYFRDKPPEWVVKSDLPHGLTFCPVLPIRNCPENPSDVDGVSIFEGLFDGFDALNFALSQRHRGINLLGTPQPWETGVEEGDGPAEDGRTAGGYTPGDINAMHAPGTTKFGAVAAKARPISPDQIWRYGSPNVKLGLLETTGKAFEVTSLHVEDIRKRLAEAIGVILVSPSDITFEGASGLNAKLLAMLYAPMLSLVESLRDEVWWPHGLNAVLSMMLRMLVDLKGVGIFLPNAKRIAEIAKRFYVTVEDKDASGQRIAVARWVDPPITPIWGDNFPPANSEIGEAVIAAVGAKDGGLITGESATRFVASYFKVEDVDDERADIDAKAEEAMQQMQDAATKPAAKIPPKKGKPKDGAPANEVNAPKAPNT